MNKRVGRNPGRPANKRYKAEGRREKNGVRRAATLAHHLAKAKAQRKVTDEASA